MPRLGTSTVFVQHGVQLPGTLAAVLPQSNPHVLLNTSVHNTNNTPSMDGDTPASSRIIMGAFPQNP